MTTNADVEALIDDHLRVDPVYLDWLTRWRKLSGTPGFTPDRREALTHEKRRLILAARRSIVDRVGVRAPDVVPRYEQLVSIFDHVHESDDGLRERYARYTADLIDRVVEDDVDRLVFLDKSGRPCAWLLRAFWPMFCPDRHMPRIHYANIDRLHWPQVGHLEAGTGLVDVSVAPRAIAELTRTFGGAPGTGQCRIPSSGRQRILVVDEVRSSGSTIEIASQFFAAAFPDCEVAGAHWMAAPTRIRGVHEVPVWYNARNPLGRGVGDRDPATSNFLSTRLAEIDRAALHLRLEIRQLAVDVWNGKVFCDDPFRPVNEELLR